MTLMFLDFFIINLQDEARELCLDLKMCGDTEDGSIQKEVDAIMANVDRLTALDTTNQELLKTHELRNKALRTATWYDIWDHEEILR